MMLYIQDIQKQKYEEISSTKDFILVECFRHRDVLDVLKKQYILVINLYNRMLMLSNKHFHKNLVYECNMELFKINEFKKTELIIHNKIINFIKDDCDMPTLLDE